MHCHRNCSQPLQQELDIFWAWRHESAKTMLANLQIVDEICCEAA
ncbi:MAG TPA: hypothetical protein VME40_09585 [Caulobacteraceae bacterium]|nr:hypothetical protein [Caulobacteraceae bacterium]